MRSVEEVARENDMVRQRVPGPPCRYLFSEVVDHLLGSGPGRLKRTEELFQALADTSPAAGDDPYGERDFGAFYLWGHKLFYKIDYVSTADKESYQDPKETVPFRVLTIMTASEY